jgi:hypothetical protein
MKTKGVKSRAIRQKDNRSLIAKIKKGENELNKGFPSSIKPNVSPK